MVVRSVVIRMLCNTAVILVTTERSEGVLLRLNEVKEVLFECIWYSIKPGPTGNWSRFCEANNLFISAPIELKLRM